MKEHTAVVVSRQYSGHEITHTVVHSERNIRIEMALDQFLFELAQDMGSRFTRRWIRSWILRNVPGVIARMKESSKHGPLPQPVGGQKG